MELENLENDAVVERLSTCVHPKAVLTLNVIWRQFQREVRVQT